MAPTDGIESMQPAPVEGIPPRRLSSRQRALTPLEKKLKRVKLPTHANVATHQSARQQLEKATGLDLHQSVPVGSVHSLALREKRRLSSAGLSRSSISGSTAARINQPTLDSQDARAEHSLVRPKTASGVASVPYHTSHRQLFNLSLLKTSTQHWEQDKQLYYTPIGSASFQAPSGWAGSLRQGIIMHNKPRRLSTFSGRAPDLTEKGLLHQELTPRERASQRGNRTVSVAGSTPSTAPPWSVEQWSVQAGLESDAVARLMSIDAKQGQGDQQQLRSAEQAGDKPPGEQRQQRQQEQLAACQGKQQQEAELAAVHGQGMQGAGQQQQQPGHGGIDSVRNDAPDVATVAARRDSAKQVDRAARASFGARESRAYRSSGSRAVRAVGRFSVARASRRASAGGTSTRGVSFDGTATGSPPGGANNRFSVGGSSSKGHANKPAQALNPAAASSVFPHSHGTGSSNAISWAPVESLGDGSKPHQSAAGNISPLQTYRDPALGACDNVHAQLSSPCRPAATSRSDSPKAGPPQLTSPPKPAVLVSSTADEPQVGAATSAPTPSRFSPRRSASPSQQHHQQVQQGPNKMEAGQSRQGSKLHQQSPSSSPQRQLSPGASPRKVLSPVRGQGSPMVPSTPKGPLSKQYAGPGDMWNPHAAGAVRPGSGMPWDYQTGVYNPEQAAKVAMLVKREHEAQLDAACSQQLEQAQQQQATGGSWAAQLFGGQQATSLQQSKSQRRDLEWDHTKEGIRVLPKIEQAMSLPQGWSMFPVWDQRSRPSSLATVAEAGRMSAAERHRAAAKAGYAGPLQANLISQLRAIQAEGTAASLPPSRTVSQSRAQSQSPVPGARQAGGACGVSSPKQAMQRHSAVQPEPTAGSNHVPLVVLESSLGSSIKMQRMLNDARQFGDRLQHSEHILFPVAHRMQRRAANH